MRDTNPPGDETLIPAEERVACGIVAMNQAEELANQRSTPTPGQIILLPVRVALEYL